MNNFYLLPLNCIINFTLTGFFILIFQINYCGGDFLFFFQTEDRFSNKDNELQWTACVSLYVRETGRLKDPGVLPAMAYMGTAAGSLRPKVVPFS